MATTYCENYHHTRLDSAFYTDYMPEWVATVKIKDRLLEVWTEGDMRIFIDDEIIRTSKELMEAGITTDNMLNSIPVDSWINNSWFTLRDYEGEWIGDVLSGHIYHDLFEAVAHAEKLLVDPEFLAEYPCLNPNYVVG